MSDSAQVANGRSGGSRSADASAGQAPRGHLRKDAITALGAATIAMAFMGPATSVFFNTPLGAAHMGYGLPFGTLLALIVCFSVAGTIGAFSRRMPTAGFAYTFNTRAFGKGGGFVSGWLLAFAYLAVGPMLFAALGSFGHDFLHDNLSITIPWWVISLVALGLVLFIGSLSLDRSVETAIVFLVLELTVMMALFVTVLAKHSGSLSLAPFNPGKSLDGFSGIGYGMLWGILMFVGFESAGTLGEETKGARRAVPIALFSAVVIIGVFYVLSSYVAAIGYGAGGSKTFAGDSAPWTTLANKTWSSSVAWIVSLTVINSQFANIISGSNAAVRMIFSLGRERILPLRALAHEPPRQSDRGVGRVHRPVGDAHAGTRRGYGPAQRLRVHGHRARPRHRDRLHLDKPGVRALDVGPRALRVLAVQARADPGGDLGGATAADLGPDPSLPGVSDLARATDRRRSDRQWPRLLPVSAPPRAADRDWHGQGLGGRPGRDTAGTGAGNRAGGRSRRRVELGARTGSGSRRHVPACRVRRGVGSDPRGAKRTRRGWPDPTGVRRASARDRRAAMP